MKDNDWIVANLNNPNLGANDFYDLGMNQDNTQFLSEDQYLNSSFIQNADQFKGDNGQFNKQKFDQFYKQQAAKFGQFNQSNNDLVNFQYSPFSPDITPNSKIKTDSIPHFIEIPNPEQQTIGVEGVNVLSTPELSKEEIAQNQLIKDSATGEFLTITPNDRALTKSLKSWLGSVFSDSLVMATYDEDGTHYDPMVGHDVIHKKGDYKLNDNGTYYYETLNGRSAMGKEVLSTFDTLTVDNQGINKYDFFDSDGLDKSVTGSLFKTAATIAPMFMGDDIGLIYSGLQVGRELLKSLPMLGNMVGGLILGDDYETPSWVNSVAAKAQQGSETTSQYSKVHAISLENVLNLASDVALQWGQQKAIAKAISWANGTQAIEKDATAAAKLKYDEMKADLLSTDGTYAAKESELTNQLKTAINKDDQVTIAEQLKEFQNAKQEAIKNLGTGDWKNSLTGQSLIAQELAPKAAQLDKMRKLGIDASLGYMSVISNTDVYETAKTGGLSNREAALLTMGTTYGMFGVDKYLGLGEMFFDEPQTKKALRTSIKKEADAYMGEIQTVTQDGSKSLKQKAKELFGIGSKIGKSGVSKFIYAARNGELDTIFGEGVVGQGLGKAFGEGLEEVSEEFVTDLTKTLYNGGAFVGLWDKGNLNAFDNWDPVKLATRYGMNFFGGFLGGGMFYGVERVNSNKFQQDETRNEMIWQVRNGKTQELLDENYKRFKNGQYGSTTLSTKKADNSDSYLTAQSPTDTQNYYIYSQVKNSILALDNIINLTGTKKSDDELESIEFLKDERARVLKQRLQDGTFASGFVNDYHIATDNLVQLTNARNNIDNYTINGQFIVQDSKDGRTSVIVKPTDEQLRHVSDSDLSQKKLSLQQIDDRIKDAQQLVDDYNNGKMSLGYIEKLQFMSDSNLYLPFTYMTFEQWVLSKKIDLGNQSQFEMMSLYNQYNSQAKSLSKDKLNQAFQAYKQLQHEVDPEIKSIQENDNTNTFNYLQEIDNILNLDRYDAGVDMNGEPYSAQSDDEYNDYLERRKKGDIDVEVESKILETKASKIQELIKRLGFLDTNTQRLIQAKTALRKKDVIQQIVTNEANKSNILDGIIDRNELPGLEDDILRELYTVTEGNKEDVKNNIYSIIYNTIDKKLDGILSTYMDYVEQSLIDPEEIPTLNNLLKGYIKGGVDLIARYDVNDLNEALNKILNPDNSDELDESDKDYAEIVRNIEGLGAKSDIPKLRSLIFKFSKLGADLNLRHKLFSGDNSDYDKRPQKILYLLPHELVERITGTVNGILNVVENNKMVQSLATLESADIVYSPAATILNKLKILSKDQNLNIEEVLSALSKQFTEANSVNDFILENYQIEDLNKLLQLIKYGRAMVYSASTSPNFTSILGHNKTINSIIENNPKQTEGYEQLSELDGNTSNIIIEEFNKYEDEIQAWMALSEYNRGNKQAILIDTEKAFSSSRVQFFKTNSSNFKFTVNGKEYDLGEGLDGINSSDPVVYEQQLYNNFAKSGLTLSDLIEDRDTISKLFKLESLDRQETTVLTKSTTELSAYDKILYFLTTLSLSPRSINLSINQAIGDITNSLGKELIVLSTQQYLIQMGTAFITNPEFSTAFQKMVSYAQENTQLDRFKFCPTLEDILFMSGVGGSGKSSIVSNAIAKIIGKDAEYSGKILVVGPQETQLGTLENATGISNGVTLEKLLTGIFNSEWYKNMRQAENTDIKESITSINKQGYTVYTQVINGVQYNPTTIYNTDPTFNDPPTGFDIPKVIIIDEATFLSSTELWALNKYAEKNNIKVITLGDELQNGYTSNDNIIKNIQSFTCICPRTCKLGISLRDSGIQKAENQSKLILALNAHDEEQANQIAKSIRFRAYNKEVLNGELIVPSFDEEIIDKFKVNGVDKPSVCYIGSDQSIIDKLKSNGSINTTVLTAEQVQGQEFDFIVVDHTFNVTGTTDSNTLRALKQLYTFITRSRYGSVLIDHDLTKLVGTSVLDSYKGNAVVPKADGFLDIYRAHIQTVNNLTEEKQAATQPTTPIPEPKIVDNDETLLSTNTSEVQSQKEEEEQNKIREPIASNTQEPNTIKQSIPIPVYSEFSASRVKIEINDTIKKLTEEVNNFNQAITDLENKKVHNQYRKYFSNDSDTQEQIDGIRSAIINLKSLFSSGNMGLFNAAQLPNDQFINYLFENGMSEIAHLSNLINQLYRIEKSNNTTYTIPPNTDGVKYDLAVVGQPGTYKGNEIGELVAKLLNIKDSILFNIDHSTVTINKKDYNVEYRIAKRTKDELVGLIGFTSFELRGETLVLEATLKQKNGNGKGDTYVITLGAVESTDTYNKFVGQDANKTENYEINLSEVTKNQILLEIATNRRTELDKNHAIRQTASQFIKQLQRQYKVVSPIYIVGNGSNLSDKLKGRPVIFVSSDSNLRPEDLQSTYMDESNHGMVRCIPLDYRGFTLDDSLRVPVDLQGKTKNILVYPTQYPVDCKAQGRRAFAALWNFRKYLKDYIDNKSQDYFIAPNGNHATPRIAGEKNTQVDVLDTKIAISTELAEEYIQVLSDIIDKLSGIMKGKNSTDLNTAEVIDKKSVNDLLGKITDEGKYDTFRCVLPLLFGIYKYSTVYPTNATGNITFYQSAANRYDADKADAIIDIGTIPNLDVVRNLLNLVFHGTTYDIRNNRLNQPVQSQSVQELQSKLCAFPHGIFPEISSGFMFYVEDRGANPFYEVKTRQESIFNLTDFLIADVKIDRPIITVVTQTKSTEPPKVVEQGNNSTPGEQPGTVSDATPKVAEDDAKEQQCTGGGGGTTRKATSGGEIPKETSKTPAEGTKTVVEPTQGSGGKTPTQETPKLSTEGSKTNTDWQDTDFLLDEV